MAVAILGLSAKTDWPSSKKFSNIWRSERKITMCHRWDMHSAFLLDTVSQNDNLKQNLFCLEIASTNNAQVVMADWAQASEKIQNFLQSWSAPIATWAISLNNMFSKTASFILYKHICTTRGDVSGSYHKFFITCFEEKKHFLFFGVGGWGVGSSVINHSCWRPT